MKANLTELVMILDASGSMWSLTDDTIGGFNSLLNSQKEAEGEAIFTAVKFNDSMEYMYKRVNINKVKELTKKEYFASGYTALLDALGTTIDYIGKELANTVEDERPSKVIFAVITDGMENASREYTYELIQEKIKHQREVYNWQFMFIGANIDAIGESEKLGMDSRFARNYTASSVGTQAVYGGLSKAMSCMRDASFDIDDDYCMMEMSACLDEVCIDSNDTEENIFSKDTLSLDDIDEDLPDDIDDLDIDDKFDMDCEFFDTINRGIEAEGEE